MEKITHGILLLNRVIALPAIGKKINGKKYAIS